MARRTDDVASMEPFILWLTRYEDKSPGTAKAYASSVRQILRELGDRICDAEAVQAYFDDLRQSKPRSYSARLTGYNAWRDYRLADSDGEESLPVAQKAKGTTKAADLPPEVCAALRTLRHECAIGFRELALMTWEDVELLPGARGDVYHVRDPTQKGVSFRANADAIDVLMVWSDPASVYLPLVPREPGSDQPYSAKGLQREASKGQETVQEKVARLRKEERQAQRGAANPETVTAHTYRSKYLPQSRSLDSIEDRLGLTGKPAPRKAIPHRADPAPSSFPTPSSFSNGSSRPEGAIERAAALLGVRADALEAVVKLLSSQDVPEHSRIIEKPPVVGEDGLFYDPNDPDFD
jgi:hypothetical protein